MKIKLTQNPWFVPACGVALLAMQAWITSPLEMLVMDMPWFVAIVGGLRVARTMSDDAPADQRPLPTRSTKAVLALLALGTFLAAAALIVWWRITDSGMVGWLDAVQARHGGKYSPRLSLLTAFAYLFDVGAAAVALAVWLGRSSRDAGGGKPGPAPTASVAPVVVMRPADTAGKHALVFVFGGMIAATWTIGFVAYEVVTMGHRAELQARYSPVELGATQASVPAAEFLALHGAPHALGHLSVRHGQAREKTHYLPLVAQGARRDDPVRWIVRAEADAMPALPATVLVHATSQAVPQSVQEGLARMGVQLTRDVRLVSLVPSMNGHVESRLEEDRDFFVGVAGFASVVILLLWAMLSVRGFWQRRNKAAAVK